MAKQIKAIACPKCGSTQKTVIRPDTFRCDNCGTEYYLDNDDITINIRQVPDPVPRPVPVPASRLPIVRLLVGLGMGSLVLLFVLVHFMEGKPTQSAVTLVPSYREPAEQPSWNNANTALLSGANGQPVLVVAGSRGSFRHQQFAPTVGFYNARTGAVQQLIALPGKAPATAAEVKLKQLSDGTLYGFCENAAYQLSAAPPGVRDITADLQANQPALASGVATIEPGPNDDDALRVFTNDGHNLNLYPLIQRTYTNAAQWSAAHGFGTLRPGSPARTGFAFSHASVDYPEEPIRLITYQYRDNGGGPQDAPRFQWQDDYGGFGSFTEADPHTKRFLTASDMAQDRVLSLRDFTPGRHYFNPDVLYKDADCVLLTFQATAAPNSPRIVQALDAHTAAIRFSTPLPAEASAPDQALRYPGGFIIGSGRTTYPLSPTGQLGPAVTVN
ncbi:transposase [Hymenobacter psoromatis]|uniref:transposase n=1 Tax=Hymenobacter psoromatis TaxID=1484116 RepID=UPI001CBC1C12|nr:transposase [Hymenobacter psoromatis]